MSWRWQILPCSWPALWSTCKNVQSVCILVMQFSRAEFITQTFGLLNRIPKNTLSPLYLIPCCLKSIWKVHAQVPEYSCGNPQQHPWSDSDWRELETQCTSIKWTTFVTFLEPQSCSHSTSCSWDYAQKSQKGEFSDD